jgi:hypothetical protein
MTEEPSVVEWLDCPECGLPAFVVDRFAMRSTDGPVVHAVTICPRLHCLRATESDLVSPARDEGRPTAPRTRHDPGPPAPDAR